MFHFLPLPSLDTPHTNGGSITGDSISPLHQCVSKSETKLSDSTLNYLKYEKMYVLLNHVTEFQLSSMNLTQKKRKKI